MGALPTTGPMTVAEFEILAEQSRERLELLDGFVREQEMPKFLHQWIQARLYDAIRSRITPDTFVCVEMQYRPTLEYTLLYADVGVLNASRCTEALATGYVSGAPDIVVEVLSPSNNSLDLDRRRNLCFANGCQEFWIINPDAHTVQVWTPDAIAREFKPGEHVGSPLIGNTKVPVSQIFA